MKKKSEKQKDMETLRTELKKAANIFLTGYEKLTVQQDFELRKTVRGAGGSYDVHVQSGNGRGPGGGRFRDQRPGDAAIERRDFLEVAVCDQRAGATTGDGDERGGTEFGGGCGSRRQGKQVLRLVRI